MLCAVEYNFSGKVPFWGLGLGGFKKLLFYRMEIMIQSTLISYITADYTTRSDMKVGIIEWQKIIQEMAIKFKQAGALRQTASQVWSKEGVFRVGYTWEYKDEKSFRKCQILF